MSERALSARARSGEVDGLQAALAAEHAVVWGYGVVGGKVPAALLPAVREADAAHRTRRDALVALVRRYGGDPVPTEAAYALPFAVTEQRSALRLAVHLEEGAAAAWRYAVVATDSQAVRRTALSSLTDAAVRATRWRLRLPQTRPTEPFPGQDAP
ncbi:MAG TPA: ferritin-like domain-containing protein [Mycobacteriales bacterium]